MGLPNGEDKIQQCTNYLKKMVGLWQLEFESCSLEEYCLTKFNVLFISRVKISTFKLYDGE